MRRACIGGGFPYAEAESTTMHASTRRQTVTLSVLAVVSALGFGALATLAPDLFAEAGSASGPRGVALYFFEIAAAVAVLSLLARVIEHRARAAARGFRAPWSSTARGASDLAADATPSEKLERLVGRGSRLFVPLVVGIAIVTFFAWWRFGPAPTLAHAALAGIAVLTIASPRAFRLAVTLPLSVAAREAERRGLMVRDGDVFERLADVTAAVVDKTGTVTEGAPRIEDVTVADGFDRAELEALVARVERRGKRPLVDAIALAERGDGVRERIDGRELVFGTRRHFDRAGIAIPDEASVYAERRRHQGETVAFAAVDGVFAGSWSALDPVRSSSRKAVQTLQRLGARVVMVTADARGTALAVAREIDLHEADVFANVPAREKGRVVATLQKRGAIVAVAGDAILDAAALEQADVGIAIADVDLAGVARLMQIGRRTTSNIRQNLWLALVYNVVAIPVAAGAFFPSIGLSVDPIFAAGTAAASSLAIVTNALRLRRA